MSEGETKFNPNNPNNFNVEAQLLLIPGFLIVVFVVYLIYRLLNSYKVKEREREEKKRKREERKKKVKVLLASFHRVRQLAYIIFMALRLDFLKSKGTTIKDALQKWEAENGVKSSESEQVKLYALIPPIEKMDASLSTLANCTRLSLSTNCIEKIANLNGLKNLKILSLGRNNIKNLNGLEAVADTLEELWISYNSIEKLKGIGVLKKLKVLYMSNNLVKAWDEFQKLAELPALQDLLFVGNPLEEKHSTEGDWRDLATTKLPKLKKLDGVPVVRQDEEED